MRVITNENFERIKKQYNVPAKRGGRILFQDGSDVVEGVITNSDGQYLMVQFDAYKKPLRLHPTWGITYLNEVRP